MVSFDQHDSRKTGRHKPPPNYFSRRVQLRLLVLVGMFMLVLTLMFEARKPENWRWMWELDRRGQQGAKKEPRANGEGDPTTAADLAAAGESGDPGRLALRDAWSTVSAELTAAERARLYLACEAAAGQAVADERFAAEDRERWAETLVRLDEGWQRYLDHARTVLENSPDASEQWQRDWREVLARIESRWRESYRPILLAVAEDQPAAEQARAAAAELKRMLDELALEKVTDNSVLRSAEYDAWYHLLHTLAGWDESQVRALPAEFVSFVQLNDQPAAYRGRLVTIRGTVKGGDYLAAPENAYDITGYFRMWILPAGGPSSPIVVYALELPPGFPQINVDRRTRAITPLDEEVEVTGFFFKRWVYAGRKKPETAPLVLAKVARWQPRPPLAADKVVGFNWAITLVCIIVAVGVGIGIAAVAYWRSRWDSMALKLASSNPAAASSLKTLEQTYTGSSVEEKLRDLSRKDNEYS